MRYCLRAGKTSELTAWWGHHLTEPSIAHTILRYTLNNRSDSHFHSSLFQMNEILSPFNKPGVIH